MVGGGCLAEVVRVTTIAIEGLHQHGNTAWCSTIKSSITWLRSGRWSHVAAGDVNDMLPRLLITVIAAIDMEARTVEMGERGCQAQTLGRRGGNEAVEFGHANGVRRIESSPERVIVEMARLNAGGNEARERLLWKKWGTR